MGVGRKTVERTRKISADFGLTNRHAKRPFHPVCYRILLSLLFSLLSLGYLPKGSSNSSRQFESFLFTRSKFSLSLSLSNQICTHYLSHQKGFFFSFFFSLHPLFGTIYHGRHKRRPMMKRVGRPGPKKKKKRKPPPCSLITITRRLKFKLDISKSVVVQKNKGTCFYLIYFFFLSFSLVC